MQYSLSSNQALNHLKALDTLRGIAIFLVLLYHAQIEVYPDFKLQSSDYDGLFISSEVSFWKILINIFPTSFGASGVELFLLISGYLIHRSYILRKDSFNVIVFYIKRLARIFPPYIFSMIVLFPILEWTDYLDWIRHVFMIHNLFESSFFSLNPSYWSLALEIQLYIVYPIALFFTHRIGSNRLLFLLFLVSIASSCYAYINFPDSRVWDKLITKFWLFWYLGAYIAEKHAVGIGLFRKHVIVMFSIFIAIMLTRITILFNPMKFYMYTLFHLVLLDWLIMSRKNSDSGVVHKYLQYAGLISYSLYLYHQPIMRWLIRIARNTDDYSIVTIAVLASLIVVHFISHYSYKFIEVPSISYGKKIIRLFRSK